VGETLRIETRLVGDGTAAEERFARFPKGYTMRGLFFPRIVASLGPRGWEEVKNYLLAPPRNGRYVAFKSYPQVDYSRLCHAAARRRHPMEPTREAMRLLARHDWSELAESRMGKVSMAFVEDARGALKRIGEFYSLVLNGGRVVVDETEDEVELRFEKFYGWLDCYPVGTVEGAVMHYGGTPRVTLDLRDELNGSIRVAC